MAYTLVFKPAFDRLFAKLTDELRARIWPHIEALATNPRPNGVEKLSDSNGLYRIRVGVYRVIFAIDDGAHTVTLTKVSPRDKAY